MAKKKKTSKVNASSSKKALTAEEISEKYTVRELREILRENDLSVSGKKQELVERVLPILNADSNEKSGDDADSDLPINDGSISSTLTNFGINYDDLAIKDESVMEDNAIINIEGFTQNGIIMSDSTLSIVSSDSSNSDLKMNIPEVSYSDFESTVFTFKNLDLSILPSSNPQSLELSALIDDLEIMTERDYVNLKGLNLFSKAFPDEKGVCLDIGISNFLYPNFYNTGISFEDLDFIVAIGLDGEKLAISVKLPKLNIINKDYRVILSDLNLNFALHEMKLSDFDLSISISDFHYTNFDDVVLYMDDINVSLSPILNSNSFDVIIGMNGFDISGITFNELFPMLNIDSININAPDEESELPINMTGHISPLDLTKIDLLSIGALLSAGFDMDTYDRNMSSIYNGSFDIDLPGLDIVSIFENFDYSSLDSIVLNLSGLIDLMDIDFTDFGIDLSDYDLSAINLADIFDALSKSDFSLSTIKSMFNIINIDPDDLDMSGLISFDAENFDMSSLIASLNISLNDISGILETVEASDLDLGRIFANVDLSGLDGIKLDLTGLIDSIGIDFSALGIDLSDYNLSAIKISELMDITNKFDLDMSTIISMLKLSDINLSEIDFSGLIASFDEDNFDLSSLIGSLDLSGLDISAMKDLFNNLDLDFESIFENVNYSCLNAIVLDLSDLIDSADIDLSALGIDISNYDLSAISLSDIMDILLNSDFFKSAVSALLNLFSLDWNEFDMSGLLVSLDLDELDISALLGSLNISGLDISGILDILNEYGFDISEFLKELLGMFMENTVPELANNEPK